MAFEILTRPSLKLNERIKINLIKKLSECSGHLGIAGGQYPDLNYEKKKLRVYLYYFLFTLPLFIRAQLFQYKRCSIHVCLAYMHLLLN